MTTKNENNPTEFLCLQPEYVSRFRCDGTKCEAFCCVAQWKISFDYATYQKYCAIADKSERQALTKHLKYDKEAGYFIVQRPNMGKGACPFLRKDLLCSIQKARGEDYLPITCIGYPRSIHRIDNLIERALKLSCPVAAKLALLPKEPMVFEQVTVPRNRLYNLEAIGTGIDGDDPRAAFALTLQCGCISILQNRALTINERLVMLGFFLAQADEAVTAPNLSRLENLITAYDSDEFIAEMPTLLSSVKFMPQKYLKCIIGDVGNAIYGKGAKLFGRQGALTNYITEFFGFSARQKTVGMAKMLERYENELRGYQHELLDKYAHIFENFLVNEFWVQLYPFKTPGSLFNDYKVFVSEYKWLELCVAAWAYRQRDKVDEEFLVDAIKYVATVGEHNADYINALIKLVIKRQEELLSFMSTFIDVGRGSTS